MTPRWSRGSPSHISDCCATCSTSSDRSHLSSRAPERSEAQTCVMALSEVDQHMRQTVVPMEVQRGPPPLPDVPLVDPVLRWLEDESDPAMDTWTRRDRVRRLQSEYPSVWQRHSLNGTFPPSPEVRSAPREMGGLVPDMGAEDQPSMDLVPFVQPDDTPGQPQHISLPATVQQDPSQPSCRTRGQQGAQHREPQPVTTAPSSPSRQQGPTLRSRRQTAPTDPPLA